MTLVCLLVILYTVVPGLCSIIASERGHTQVVNALLKQNANIQACTRYLTHTSCCALLKGLQPPTMFACSLLLAAADQHHFEVDVCKLSLPGDKM